MKIKAIKPFSHYHLGTISTGEVRDVSDETGQALIGMNLAEEIPPDPEVSDGNKRRSAKADKGSS